ncbi:MAG: alpha/beta fold hydrolase [Firmicutes bacterium]|nr:alpha/beta fold hydrolase [Bacillota bacterium]
MRTEEITIQVENFALRGRAYWPGSVCSPDKDKPFLILCHGIPRAGTEGEKKAVGQEGGSDGGYPALAARCASLGLPVFHFNFRGTGESEGDFDLPGWTRDLLAFLDYWEKRGAERGFSLWGFSAGAAVSACVAAAEPRVKNVILAACPASFRKLFPREGLDQLIDRFRRTGIIRDPAFPYDPVQWLEGIYAVEPVKYIARLAPRPLLLAHGTADELIPYSHAFELYRQAGRGRQLLILPGARHQLRRDEKAVDFCLKMLEEMARQGT